MELKKKVCFKIFSIEVLLIYNVSSIEQNDSVIYVYIYIYIYSFSDYLKYRMLSLCKFNYFK